MTLTELSYQSRIIAKLGGALFAVMLLFYFMISLMIGALKRPEELVAEFNTSFGKLEKPSFTAALAPRNLKFVLDTLDGELPSASAAGTVYFIPEKQTTLLYMNKITSLAQSFGFNTEEVQPVKLDDTWMQFEDGIKLLKVDIKHFNFEFYMKPTFTLQRLIEATADARFAAREQQYIEVSRLELQKNDSYPADLAAGKANPVYVRYDLATAKFVPVQQGQMPQAVRIDFFRRDIDSLTTVQPTYFDAKTYVILAPLTSEPEIIAMKYTHFDRLETDPGNYPLMPVAKAWEMLKANKAAIISLSGEPQGSIHIKQIFPAFYDPAEYQRYFQPIYVFLGDNNYVGYLPAVDAQYLLGEEEATPAATTTL